MEHNLVSKIDNIERKVAISEIWKNYLGLAAVIIGGFWVVYTFNILQSSYLTHLNVENIEASRVLLDFDIKVAELDSSSESLIGLEIEIIVTNQGTLPVRIDLSKSDSSCGVVKLKPGVNVNQDPNIGKFYKAESFSFYNGKNWGVNKSIVALPKVTTTIKYFVQVQQTGYYFVSFSAPIDIDAQQAIEKRETGCKQSSSEHIWSVQKYFSVLGKESSKAN
jgi:hypothetical protein